MVESPMSGAEFGYQQLGAQISFLWPSQPNDQSLNYHTLIKFHHINCSIFSYDFIYKEPAGDLLLHQ